MNKKNKILVTLCSIFIICGLLSTKFLNQESNSLSVVKANEKDNKETFNKNNKINNKKIYSNNVEDKEALLNLMVNSICYYSTASGNFDYYSANAETDMNIDFNVDLLNNKSYEKHLFKNIKTRSNLSAYEEASFNGTYYSVYRSDGYLEDLNSSNTKTNNAEFSQLSYRKIYTPNSLRSGSREYSAYSDAVENVDGENVYVRKNETSMMGVAATVLLPEDFAMNFMTSDLDNWKIIGNETYINRNTVFVECSLNDYYTTKHNAKKSIIRIDVDTGIVLEANLVDSVGKSTFRIKMNNLVLDELINNEVFEKHTSEIKE